MSTNGYNLLLRNYPLLIIVRHMDQSSSKEPAPASETIAQPCSPALFSWSPWLMVSTGIFLLFVVVTWLVLTHEEVQSFDRLCRDTMKEHAQNHVPVRHFFWLTTWLGGVVGLTLLSSAGTIVLFVRKNYLLAAIWVLAAGGGALVNLGVKHSVNNPRPATEDRDPAVAWLTNPSYPSGHAMGSTIGLGMCLFMALHFLKRKPEKILMAVGLAVLILLIGFSRIYLRAHWFTDVLGGFALGASWLVFCLAIYWRLNAITKPALAIPDAGALTAGLAGQATPAAALAPGTSDS
jgi:undecaprenyl-diphosphatase